MVCVVMNCRDVVEMCGDGELWWCVVMVNCGECDGMCVVPLSM